MDRDTIEQRLGVPYDVFQNIADSSEPLYSAHAIIAFCKGIPYILKNRGSHRRAVHTTPSKPDLVVAYYHYPPHVETLRLRTKQ